MEHAVISERFLELISGRKVQAALFTTYAFEPDFFELDVIPLLLNQDADYSLDDRVKSFMVCENLRASEIPIDVYYDLPTFRVSGDCSPEMEYLCHGVLFEKGGFHGKVTMVLLKDEESGVQSLLLGAGSNNLTRSGWWENIECLHWEEIRDGTTPQRLISVIKEDVEFLKSIRATAIPNDNAAIDLIEEFLLGCGAGKNATTILYFGLSTRGKEKNKSFFDFLRGKPSPLAKQDNWRLEIVSPFFANDPENREHNKFLEMGISDIKLYLPFDNENNVLCQRDYYEHILKEEKICWAKWKRKIGGELEWKKDHHRRLHAKLYHFYNEQESWVFVGSINFTRKALYDNIEAGYLVKLNGSGALLERITDNRVILGFSELDDTVPGKHTDEEISSLPELHLCFDWVSKRLMGRSPRDHEYEIEILNSEGESVINPWNLCCEQSEYVGNTERLQKLLKNGSLVTVKGKNVKNYQMPFPTHSVLLQQIGWSHKPLDMPDLTASQILAIYAGISPERRQLMLVNAKIRMLIANVQGGQLSSQIDDENTDQFFCEYAEIFNAFSKLINSLNQALNKGRHKLVDYYLTGTGVDSLPSLAKRMPEEDESLSGVTRYLLLLSLLEVYDNKNFVNRPEVESEKDQIIEKIQEIKNGSHIEFENNSPKFRNTFFKWFEQEFFRSYIPLEIDS